MEQDPPSTALCERLSPGPSSPVSLAAGPVLEAESQPDLQLLPAVVLHAEDEDGAGEGAVGVVVGEAGGDLPADQPHPDLRQSAQLQLRD